MGAIKTGWDFFQDQILGMHWLKDLIGNLLVKAGMGESRFPGEFLHYGTFGRAHMDDFLYSELFSAGEK